MGPLHGLPVSLKVSARWKCSIRPLLTVYSSQGFIQPEGHSSNNWICIIHQPPTSRFQLSTRGDLAQGRSRALRQDQSSSDFDDGRLREQCVWPNTGNWPSKHRYAHFIDRLQNPYKLNLTAGGSSGGEGALVGMRGSLLGVGTDIGGSIRIPALCCGTFGFKPSTDRIAMGGQANPVRDGKSMARLPRCECEADNA